MRVVTGKLATGYILKTKLELNLPYINRNYLYIFFVFLTPQGTGDSVLI